MTGTVELAEGTRVRIGGALFRVVHVIDDHEPLALLVAQRTDRTSRRSMRSPDPSSTKRFPHIDDEVQPLLWGPVSDRVDRFRAFADSAAPWIERSAQERVISALHVLVDRADDIADKYLAVVGPSGAGKRTAVRKLAERRSMRASARSAFSVPVVTVRSWVSSQQLYEACIAGVDVHGADLSRALRRPGLKNAQRREIAINAMKAAGVRVLLVEALHHYVDPTSMQIRQRIETLDAFVSDLGVALACLHRRPIRLPGDWPSPWRNAQQLTLERCALGPEFDRALHTFERRLPLREPSGLDRPDLAGRLYAFSQGDLGVLWSHLVECASEALRSKTERIDHASIDSIERTESRPAEAAWSDD